MDPTSGSDANTNANANANSGSKTGAITTWTRSCCPESTCQVDTHTNVQEGQEFDADSCLTDNCNTMDPTSGSAANSNANANSGSTSTLATMSPSNLILVLLFGSTTLSSLIA